mmetsp:Transcript_64136/g.171721  ORF Transcript_64136/g.171721 Transcript_64136/m.171721 type:complete len:82 (+) Transcript_64136:89-334(+)
MSSCSLLFFFTSRLSSIVCHVLEFISVGHLTLLSNIVVVGACAVAGRMLISHSTENKPWAKTVVESIKSVIGFGRVIFFFS